MPVDNGSIEVQYYPLVSGSTMHIHGRLLTFNIPEKAEYVQGRPLSQELVHIVTRDGWRIEEVATFLKRYLHILLSMDVSREIPLPLDSADIPIPGELFDALPQNIIVGHDGEWQVIDKEWTLNDDIPAGWMIFRSLHLLIHSVTRFGTTSSDFMNTPLGFFLAAFKATGFAITEDEIERYANLEMELQIEVARRPLKYEEFLKWLRTTSLPRQNLNQAVVERDGQIIHLNQAMAERELQITALNQAVSEQERVIVERLTGLYTRLLTKEGELRHVSAQLDRIYSSFMWQVISRVRKLRDRLCPDGSLSHRVYIYLVHWLKGSDRPETRRARSNDGSFDRILKIAKTMLPVFPNRKYRLVSFIFKRCGPIFAQTESYQRWKEQQPPVLQGAMIPSIVSFQGPSRSRSLSFRLIRMVLRSLSGHCSFGHVEQPLVSIVIPVYNHLEYTVCCLASLLKHDPQAVLKSSLLTMRLRMTLRRFCQPLRIFVIGEMHKTLDFSNRATRAQPFLEGNFWCF